jgi:hypothetical protein
MTQQQSAVSDRPDFMAALDLLPPYTLEDVRKAYKAKARHAHPDAGGQTSDFMEITEAYKRAVEYVEFRGSPREWVAARVERYVEQSELVAGLRAAGGAVELEEADWRRRELGEFAQVGEQIVAVRINAPADIPACFTLLLEKQHLLDKLILLDLGNSRVTDLELGALPAFGRLRRLDLRRTAVSFRGLQILSELPDLTTLNLGGTRVTRWQRYRLGRRHPQLRIVLKPDVPLDASPSQATVLADGG